MDSSSPSEVLFPAFFKILCVEIRSGLTQADNVTAPETSSDGLASTTTYWLPCRPRPPECTPATHEGTPTDSPWLPRPEASDTNVPEPSSIFQCPKRASPADSAVKPQGSDQGP